MGRDEKAEKWRAAVRVINGAEFGSTWRVCESVTFTALSDVCEAYGRGAPENKEACKLRGD